MILGEQVHNNVTEDIWNQSYGNMYKNTAWYLWMKIRRETMDDITTQIKNEVGNQMHNMYANW